MLPTIQDKDIPGADPGRLLYCFQPLIKKVAQRYTGFLERSGAVGFEDLVQVGNIALLDAQSHYDPDKGASFVSFSCYFLRSAMRSTLGFYGNGRMNPPPVFDYLDAPLMEEDPEAGSIVDTIPDPNAIDAAEYFAEEAEREEVASQVRAAVARLKSARQREAIQRVYLDGQDCKTAAEEMGIERRQLHSLNEIAKKTMRRDHRLKKFAYSQHHVTLRQFNTTFTSEQEEWILWKEARGEL